MCKEVEMYREKWKSLEEATQKLKMEIFGLKCKITGIMAFNEDNKNYYNKLNRLRIGLDYIDIKVSEEEFIFFIPEYFLDNHAGVCGVMDFNVDATVEIVNKLKEHIIEGETQILFGNRTLTCQLLIALEDFKDAFLNYMK